MKTIFKSIATFAFAAAFLCFAAQIGAKESGKMTKIYYQGHGSLRLTTGGGVVVYIDPYAGDGYDVPADLILVTHQHQDHNKIDLVEKRNKDCVILQNSDMLVNGKCQTKTVKGIKIEAVEAYNKNHPKDQCVGYVLTVDDKQIYVAGDTSTTEQMADFAKRKIDLAFLPCDGKFNMDIDEAVKCAKTIKAKKCVPYHISPGKLFDAERAAKFVVEGALIVEAGKEFAL